MSDVPELRRGLEELADLIQSDMDDARRVLNGPAARRPRTSASILDLICDVEFNAGRLDVLVWALNPAPERLEESDPLRLLSRAVQRYAATAGRESDVQRARSNGEREGLCDLAKAVAP